MSLTIDKDVLQGPNVTHFSTTKKGTNRNQRKFIVVHYTASDNFDGDVKTLSSSSKQVSCHLVISREGDIAMVGSFNDVQWHAGASQWKGINGLNSYSIGIEMTNPGWMEISDDKKTATTYYGKRYLVEQNQIVFSSHKALGNKVYGWLPYSAKQIAALTEVVETLKDHYGTIEEVVGHEQISPGRKQDPGIGIILSQKLLDKFNETNFDGSDHFYTGTDPVAAKTVTTAKVTTTGIYTVKTSGTALRIRNVPSSTASVIGSLNNGQAVVIDSISNGWAKLKSIRNGPFDVTPATGYVSAAYIVQGTDL
jgi:N-acetylmuramoyl-L-alanine amidase